MRRGGVLAMPGAALLGLAATALCAEGAGEIVQTKTGIVRRVDVAASQAVVMVARELTFTVTEATKIVQGEEARKLTDIKGDARVAVDYTREGDTRTAKKIAILADRE